MRFFSLLLLLLFIGFQASAQQEDYFITTWKTDNDGISNNTSITIPTYIGETYEYDVSWNNDGVWETGFTGDATHDYGVAGTYTVAIRGVFPRIYFNNEGDSRKIISIDQWGTISWNSMANAFYGCWNVEGNAPHGIAILIETATDNNTRTVANIRSYFNKCDGNMGTSGSVSFMFDHSCNFRIHPEGMDIEELELELIDHGLEEIFEDEDGILIYAPFESFGDIQSFLEEKNIEILSSGFERIPQVTKKLNAEEMADVENLLEKIEEDDDVQNVYHTMEESTEE